MNEKFLPIGTVVKLKGGTKKIMITSYLVFPNNRNGKSEMFEYGACPYPTGIIDSKYAVGFNHEQIAEIIYLGHVDEEQKEFIVTGCVIEVGPETKYLKEGDVVYYRRDTVVPVPFFKQGLVSLAENQVIAVVNEGLTERFNNV